MRQTAQWIERRENVIALGPSGTGKTHVALGLGLVACQKGMSVGFTTASALVSEMMEAADMAEEIAMISSGLLARRFGAIARPDLLTAVIIGRGLVNAAGEGALPEEGLSERVVTAIEAYLLSVSGGR